MRKSARNKQITMADDKPNVKLQQNPGGHFLSQQKVVCDGGATHPKIFLTLNQGSVTCPYCSNVFHWPE